MGPWPNTLIYKPKKKQQFEFQTSGILLLAGVQKLYGPEISQFLPCVLQVLDNLRQLFISSNYIGEIDHFTLVILKRSDTGRPEEFLLLGTIQNKTTMNKSLAVRS